MKCEYCGGEVGSLTKTCPFCGRENKSYTEFQTQVDEKIKRNKELPRIILKLKEKEIASKLITRINLGLLLCAIVVLVLSFGLFCMSEDRREAEMLPGSQAEKCLEEMGYMQKNPGFYRFQYFVEASESIVMSVENEEEINRYDVENLLTYSYDVMREVSTAENPEEYRDYELFIKAFYRGYLDFTEEELRFLADREKENSSYSLEHAERDRLVSLVYEKLEGGN